VSVVPNLPTLPLDAILDAAPDAVIVLDADGRIAFANDRAEALFGYSREELLGQGAEMLTPEDLRDDLARRRRRYIDTAVAHPFEMPREFRGLHRDGREIPIEASINPLRTDQGTFVVSTLRDVSERRRMESLAVQARHRQAVLELGRLALSDITLQDLLERAAEIAVSTLDVDRALISELREGTLIRRAVAGRLPVASAVVPVSRTPMSARALATDTPVLRGGPGQPPVPEVLEEDGICLAAVVPIRGQLARFGVLGAYRAQDCAWAAEEIAFLESLAHLLSAAVEGDAARRAAAEMHARLLAVLDNSPAVIAIKNLEGRYLVVNRRFEEVFGITAEQALAMTPHDYMAPGEADTVRAHDREVLAAGRAMEVEEVFAFEDGTHTYRSLKFPMRDAEGTIYGVGVIATDITEGLRSQQEREELEARLHRVDRLESIGRLAGGIAHDFNNLLAVIRNYASFLVEDLPEGSQSREDLEQIRRAVDRATSLTRQLLIFARKERSAPRPLPLNEVVRDTERLLRRTLGEDVHLHTELDHSIPAVELDPGQAEQVLVNLALNARDAMPDGGTLTICTSSSDGRAVQLVVRDTGTGMPPEVADRAFEPFFTSKPEGKGTGLGLAMVYGVITGAGGTVDLQTAEGRGTTVTLTLPASNEPAPEEPERADEPPRGRGETVLVVEDADALRDLTRRILAEAGYKVVEARNGVQAVRIVARQGPIDLLLTDVVMPGMSGRELAQRMLDKHPSLPILFMSGYTDDALLGDEFAHTTLLEKPFDADQLLRAVRAELDRAKGAPKAAGQPDDSK
jgi:two-component system, cell cycle sensor histidine kinase and response regulator CckA